MRVLLNTRHPMHLWSGWLVIAGCLCVTAAIAVKRPKINEISLTNRLFTGTRGEKGQWTEILPRGEYTLICESSEGDGNILRLKGVTANYIENPPGNDSSQRILVWHITAPAATHETEDNNRTNGVVDAVDTLDGPLSMEVRDISGTLLGYGKIEQGGPALRRISDVWLGLAPLHWIHEDKTGRGEYLLPKGWRKESDDQFVVKEGNVVWNSLDGGLVRSLTAGGLNAKNASSGVLDSVTATLDGGGPIGDGKIWAEKVEVAEQSLRFSAPIRFEHQRGWSGTASEGTAIRPTAPDSGANLITSGNHGADKTTKPLRATGASGHLDLADFEAHGMLGTEFSSRNISSINVHSAKANKARWTAAGLQMEGSVAWDLEVVDRNGRATRYLLKAPKTYYRSGPGDDLPDNLAQWSIRAEGNPVLAWDDNLLNSPGMTYQVAEQVWNLENPVIGTVPGGSFRAGSGNGSTSGWVFSEGIRADFQGWGTLQGNRLTWTEKPDSVYTLTGNPATMAGPGRRLSGNVISRYDDQLQFPSGIQGSITFRGETFTLSANRAEIIRNNAYPAERGISLSEIRLSGRVECSAPGYRFSSREVRIVFEDDRPRQLTASGGISLQGSIGSGFGDTIELVFDQGWGQPRINWSGRVQGNAEVSVGR